MENIYLVGHTLQSAKFSFVISTGLGQEDPYENRFVKQVFLVWLLSIRNINIPLVIQIVSHYLIQSGHAVFGVGHESFIY